jgi:hypothetical protein
MNAARDTEPGEHYCRECKRKTRWVLKRGVQVCEGCGDRFPCRSTRCKHNDCELARSPEAA